MAHAKLAPSAASMWVNCSGQPEMARGIEKEETEYMLRGTAAHAVLQHCAEHLADPSVTPRNPNAEVAATVTAPFGVKLEKEDLVAIQEAVDFYRRETEPGDEVTIEEKLRLTEDCWGTCDFSRYRPSTGELLVADYKHGAGVAVDAEGNLQGLIYAIMKAKALGNRGFSSVRFVIVQPRAFHAVGTIREFVIEAVDMLDWEDRVIAAIEETRRAAEGDVRLRAGSWCRWCPANAICPAARAAGAPKSRPGAQLAEGYDLLALAEELAAADAIEDRIKAVKAFAHSEAERGVKLPGFKLVAKRATAKWKDAEYAAGVLELVHGLPRAKIMTEPELRSPAQIRAILADEMPGKTKKAREEAARKELYDETTGLVVEESSGRSLVPDTDGRRAILTGPKAVFTNLDETQDGQEVSHG